MEKKILRIGEFIDSYYPVVDGVGVVVNNYARNFNREGESSCVVVAPKYKYIDFDDKTLPYEVLRCKSIVPKHEFYGLPTPYIDLPFVLELADTPFDIVHIHSPATIGRYGVNLAEYRGIPSVITFHSKYYDNLRKMLKLKGLSKATLKEMMTIYEKASAVWAVSNYAADILREYGFRGEIDVVDNGTDIKPYDFSEEEIKKLKSSLKYGKKRALFLYVGQMINLKNIKFSLGVMRLLKDRGLDFRFVLIGDGCDKKELVAYAERLGIADCVRFLPSEKDRTKLSMYYTRADLFVFPSKYEMASLVFREAAGCGTPSVVLENTSLAEKVVDGKNGFISPDSQTVFADKIMNALSDGKRLNEIGENAKKTIARTFEDVSNEVFERYKYLIEKEKFKRNRDKE